METDLTGQLLLAMPTMTDPRFEHAVIYICAHSDEGAMGLVVNKAIPFLTFKSLLSQLEIEPSDTASSIRVQFGGPVEGERGFVLHSLDYTTDDDTLRVTQDIGLTGTTEVLVALANGEGPKKALLALGYVGWGPGQLEDELRENAWLTAPASPDILFGRAHDDKWKSALEMIGVNYLLLSGEAGHA